MSLNIHPTALVSKEAEIGNDVTIGPYAIVDKKTKIGDRTILRANSHVCEFVEVGADCVLYEHSVIGGLPQDLSFEGEETWVHIGNNVVCREFVTVNRATGEGESTSVGNNTYIMEGVHIAHNARVGSFCTIANKSGLSGYVHIGNHTVVGGMSGFHQFVHVGDYSMVGGMSKIIQDIPPYCLAAGNPCRVYDINRIGLKRQGFNSETRRILRDIYRIIYNSGLGIKDGIAQVAALYGELPEAKLIMNFAETTKRGFASRITQDWQGK